MISALLSVVIVSLSILLLGLLLLHVILKTGCTSSCCHVLRLLVHLLAVGLRIATRSISVLVSFNILLLCLAIVEVTRLLLLELAILAVHLIGLVRETLLSLHLSSKLRVLHLLLLLGILGSWETKHASTSHFLLVNVARLLLRLLAKHLLEFHLMWI